MMLTRIHVNQLAIRSNGKDGGNRPVIASRRYSERKDKTGIRKTTDEVDYGHRAIIRDNDGNEIARVCYQPNDPLECGAKVWIETIGTVDMEFNND